MGNISPKSSGYCFRTQIGESESPFETILRALSVAKGVEPTTLPPLYDRIDPEALDALLVSESGSKTESTVAVEFPLESYRIQATNDGEVRILENSTGTW